MRKTFPLIALSCLLVVSSSCNQADSVESHDNHETHDAQEQEISGENKANTFMATGRQPQLAVDPAGITRVVYGHKDTIYYTTSSDNGATFTPPAKVGVVKGLYLGMAMGPQIASSTNYSVLTAIDKKGNIHTFRLTHNSGAWTKTAGVNDIPGSVPEGLMSIDADEKDNFYAVWLDVRNGKQNKLLYASTTGDAKEWSRNKIVYESPDKTVCECCKPSIDVKGEHVTLMFRNWLNGSRDFYFTSSPDKGKAFTTPEKLGTGTWKLEGCPMDGGGIVVDSKDNIHTVWQRDGKIYYAQPGKREIKIGKGRNCRINGSEAPIISWKDGSDLKLKPLHSGTETIVGKGNYMETARLPDQKILCVWENEGAIHFRKI